MLIKSIYNRTWAILIARLILGLIFFIAGVWKVFTLGSLEHARRMFVELIAGGLLIAGLLDQNRATVTWRCIGSRNVWSPARGTAVPVSYTRDTQDFTPSFSPVHACIRRQNIPGLLSFPKKTTA
jgi:hypothetical protein